MPLTRARLALFGLLLACREGADDRRRAETAATAPAAAVAATTRLTADGWGPLRIGMTRAEVVAALGEDANPDAVGGPDPERCDEFRPARAPQGMLVMIEGGRLTRISVNRRSEVRSERGIGTGDSVSAVLEAHGAIERLPHKYLPAPAQYLTVWTPGTRGAARRGIRYETDIEGRVAFVRGGGPSIEYVEGCA